jgi:hypothetical protein
MPLGFSIAFADLYEREGLLRVDAAFLGFLDADLRARLLEARKNPPSGKAESRPKPRRWPSGTTSWPRFIRSSVSSCNAAPCTR